MNIKVPWTRPSIGAEEAEASSQVLASGWLSQGPVVEQFEKDICEYIGCKYAVCVNNGTVALMLALLALKNQRIENEGHDCLDRRPYISYVPSSTFVATSNAALINNIPVVPVDVSQRSLVASASYFEEVYCQHREEEIAPLFMPVHLMGFAAEISGLARLGDIVEDGCQAFGTYGECGRVGEHSRLCVFSFHMAKLVSTVEGGCVVTNDAYLWQMLVNMRNQGLGKGYRSLRVGLNARMTDVHAAIGRVQIKKAEQAISHRRSLVNIYKNRLEKYLDKIHVVEPPKDNLRAVYAMCALRVSDAGSLHQVLHQGGVDARRFFPPIGTQYPQFCKQTRETPNASRLYEELVLVPMGNAITEDEVSYTCDRIEEYIR